MKKIVLAGCEPKPDDASLAAFETELGALAKTWRTEWDNVPGKTGRKTLGWAAGVQSQFAWWLIHQAMPAWEDRPEWQQRCALAALANASQFAQEHGFRTSALADI